MRLAIGLTKPADSSKQSSRWSPRGTEPYRYVEWPWPIVCKPPGPFQQPSLSESHRPDQRTAARRMPSHQLAASTPWWETMHCPSRLQMPSRQPRPWSRMLQLPGPEALPMPTLLLMALLLLVLRRHRRQKALVRLPRGLNPRRTPTTLSIMPRSISRTWSTQRLPITSVPSAPAAILSTNPTCAPKLSWVEPSSSRTASLRSLHRRPSWPFASWRGCAATKKSKASTIRKSFMRGRV